MKQFVFLFFISFLFLSCKNKKKDIISSNTETNDKKDISRINYSNFKAKIIKNKRIFKNKSAKLQSEYLYNLINNDIFFYWKNTAWDFNGTTQKPGEGHIACGYFITNTLTDLGFKIDRIKLAQAPSSKMIDELCVDVKRFSTISEVEDYLKKQPSPSVFIVGLDFHTGYLLKDETGNYFLHSTYLGKRCVMKEKTQESDALLGSKSYMIGNLSDNKKLIENWIKN